MKLFSIVISISLLLLSSCKKCKECFAEETITADNTIITTSLGEMCGSELKRTDGKTYTAEEGPARTYCK